MHTYYRSVLREKHRDGVIQAKVPDITDKKTLAFAMALMVVNSERKQKDQHIVRGVQHPSNK